MPAHQKHFSPQGKLVVGKIDGIDFGGKHYDMGEEIVHPDMTLRKKRQLYFQNKLCYDYEIDGRRQERAVEARRMAARMEAALNSPPKVGLAPAPVATPDEREQALRAEAERIRAEERIAEEAQLARDKAAYEAKFGPSEPTNGGAPAQVNSTDAPPPVIIEQTAAPAAVDEAPTVDATEPAEMASESPRRRRVVRPVVETQATA